MVKILIVSGAVFLVAIVAAYVLIPASVVFSKVTPLHATAEMVERAFQTEDERIKWWPQSEIAAMDSNNFKHEYEDLNYEFPAQTFSGSTVKIGRSKTIINSTLHFVSLSLDSTAIMWQSSLPATNNPFKKITNYFSAISIKKNMSQILDSLKAFIVQPENLYGIKIVQEKVKDTILISTTWASAAYPTTEMIYEKIDGLKDHIKANNAEETNDPMLHIFEDNGAYKSMVAIPVNRELTETNSFVVKKMVAGKILTAIVQGGVRRPATAIKKIEQYIDDHKITSPAIPFESLVTNRMQEKDSTKWITKVYYPVY